MTTRIEEFCDRNKINRFENDKGVQNLCKIAREIGYRDPYHMGQFAHDGAYGDLVEFLRDNPGAQEALYEFMCDNLDEELEEEPEGE